MTVKTQNTITKMHLVSQDFNKNLQKLLCLPLYFLQARGMKDISARGGYKDTTQPKVKCPSAFVVTGEEPSSPGVFSDF